MNHKFLVLLAFAVHAIHLTQSHGAGVDLPPGTVNLVADNGQYLRLCRNCGGVKTDSASVQASSGDNTIDWTLEIVAGGKVAFKGSNGLYLSRCNRCWNNATFSNSAFVHLPDSSAPYSQWTPTLKGNRKYSFLSDNGKLLTRCNGCIPNAPSPNFAFVHQADSNKPQAQWDVVYTNLPRQGTVQLQTDDGFLRLCTTCGDIKNAVSVENIKDANTKWKLVRVGTKVVLQGKNGNYLSRCNGCWPRASYPDSAFAHLKNYNAAISQWTPIKVNGKWSFQADTGKFLARCSGCTRTSVRNIAFVHSTGNSNPYEQFNLIYF